MQDLIMAFIIVVAYIALYMLPSIIGFVRGFSRPWTMTALNALLGVTVIGWFALFIWVLVEKKEAATHS